MYTHIHLSSIESLAIFYHQLEDKRNPNFAAKVRAYTRCVSFGFAFEPYQSARNNDPPIFQQVSKLLEVCSGRLRGFRQLGAYLSPLPSAIWSALRAHCPGIEYLEGFSLELVTRSTDDFIKELFTLQQLKRLTTTIVWLPPSFVPEVRRRILLTEEEKRQSGLLGRHCKKRFAHLESLRTPLLRWDNLLVEALMIADLPKLHSLQLDVWDSDSVTRFLEKHGQKLVHVDLLQCRWSGWPDARNNHGPEALRRPPEQFQIEDIFTSCPSLKVFTLHQPESLVKLAERGGLLEGQTFLEILRFGSTDNSSYVSTLEYQPFDEVSFPFKNKAYLQKAQRRLLATDWKKLFPQLQRIEVYLPDFMLDQIVTSDERDRRWREMMSGMVKSEEDMVPHEEVRTATLRWGQELYRKGVAFSIRPSPKVAPWQRISYDTV